MQNGLKFVTQYIRLRNGLINIISIIMAKGKKGKN